MRNSFIYRNRYLPYIISTITVIVAIFFEANNIKVAGPYIPFDWRLIKDIFDPVLIVIFPWNGWVFLGPLLFAYFSKRSLKELAQLWILTSSAMGIADSLVSFEEISISRCAKGIAFYLAVFGVVWLLGELINWIIRRAIACRK